MEFNVNSVYFLNISTISSLYHNIIIAQLCAIKRKENKNT
jgi:hypothetical protein